jgi:hypothetical protein
MLPRFLCITDIVVMKLLEIMTTQYADRALHALVASITTFAERWIWHHWSLREASLKIFLQ